ncbi:hypothetical protein D3C87_1453950 [compost metagenome]
MIDEEAATDLRPRMDVDTGGGVGDFRADPREQRQPGAIQMMGKAMVNHRQDARVAEQHFVDAARCRVAVVGRQHVGVQQTAQARQGEGEVLDDLNGPGFDFSLGRGAVAGGVAQFQSRLSQQRIQCHVQRVADIEVFALFAQVHRPQAHRKQRTTQGFQDLRHGRSGRQLPTALLAAGATVLGTPFVTRRTQLTDDGLQLPMAGTLAHGKNSSRAAGLSGRVNRDYFTATACSRIKNQ